MANGEVVKFNYTEDIADHYRYIEVVDNKNNLRHDCRTKYQIGLYITQGKIWWPIQVFSFVIACTEVNVYLEIRYFLKNDDNFMNYIYFG